MVLVVVASGSLYARYIIKSHEGFKTNAEMEQQVGHRSTVCSGRWSAGNMKYDGLRLEIRGFCFTMKLFTT